MKIFSSGLSLFLFLTALFLSCQKTDSSSSDQLQEKWYLQKEIDHTIFPSGQEIRDTTFYAGTGSYFDFKANGTVHTVFIDPNDPQNFQAHSSVYRVLNNNRIVFGDSGTSDTAVILSLTNSELILNWKTESGTFLDEITSYFAR